MAVSMFTIYRWYDDNAPILSGDTGSLLNVLDACLVNGYGTKPGAGWTKPFPNTASYGCYKMGAGTTSSLFVYDAGSGSAAGKEAMMTGFDSITSIEAGIPTGSNQYPTLIQSAIGRGSLILRKSSPATSASRPWIVAADSQSMYVFTKTLDSATWWSGFHFGDFYSILSGSTDNGRCIIIGRTFSDSANSTVDCIDRFAAINTAVAGHFISHGYTGSVAISCSKHGDYTKGSTNGFYGITPWLNYSDNAMYLSPLWLTEVPSGIVRGRLRGLYHFCHAITNVIDGQVFSGSCDFPNSTFLCIKQTGGAGANGVYILETSNTVETN